jgi:hypothetical protein
MYGERCAVLVSRKKPNSAFEIDGRLEKMLSQSPRMGRRGGISQGVQGALISDLN